MFEKRNEPLASTRKFMLRLARSIMIGLLFIVLTVFIGMVGLWMYEHMSWVDAFANSAMILSGVGAINPILTQSGKLFSGFFALASGLVYMSVAGVVFAPIVHRFFHWFHLDTGVNR